MTPQISIILPAKDSGSCIRRSIESVLAQTFTDWELLVINDGSTDDTCEIVTSLAQTDPRIKLMDSTGRGVSSARNLGLDSASGKYITFMDSDDRIDPEYLTRLIDLIVKEQADISQCSLYYWYEDGTLIKEKETVDDIFEGHNSIMHAYFSGMVGHICLAAWGKLFRSKLLSGIRFDETLMIQEDAFFTFECCMRALRVACCNDPLYFYYQRPESAMNKPFDGSKMQYFTVLGRELDICKDDKALIYKINLRKLITALDLTSCVIYDASGSEYLSRLREIALQTYEQIKGQGKLRSKIRLKVFLIRHFPSVYYRFLKIRAKRRQRTV